MFKYLLKRKCANTFIIFAILILSLLQVATALVHTFAFDSLLIGDFQVFLKIYIIGFIAYMILIFGNFFLNIYKTKIIQKTIIDIRNEYTTNIEETSYSNFSKKDIGEHISFLNNDMNLLEQSSFESFYNLISVIFITIFSLITLFKFDYRILLITILFTTIILVVPNIFSNKVSKATEKYSIGNSAMISGFTDQLQGFKDYYYLGQKHKLSNNVILIGLNYLKEKVKYKFTTGIYSSFVSLLSVVAQICILVLTGYLAAKGIVSFGAMTSVGSIAGTVFNSLSQLGALIISIKSVKAIFSKIKTFEKNNRVKEIKDISKIDIQSISYSYDNTEVLQNINFIIEKGNNYAIVGESGCGKSTLIQILLGNKREYLGQIFYNNINLDDIDENSIIDNVSYLNNKVHIFKNTLHYNITLGKYCSEIELLKLLDIVKLEEFKDRVYDNVNLDTLSEGQKQRIGILRLLLSNKDMVIFDEALSNLDEENVRIIEELFINSNKTFISISHNIRKGSLEKFDNILYL